MKVSNTSVTDPNAITGFEEVIQEVEQKVAAAVTPKAELVYRVTINASTPRSEAWLKHLFTLYPYVNLYRFFDELITLREKRRKRCSSCKRTTFKRNKELGVFDRYKTPSHGARTVAKPTLSGIVSAGFTLDSYRTLIQECYKRGMSKSQGLIMLTSEYIEDRQLLELAKKWMSRISSPKNI